MKKIKKCTALLLTGLILALSLPVTALAEALVPEVTGIEFEEVSLIQGTHGRKNTDWDQENGGFTAEYFRYSNYEPEFTVTLKNGTVLESQNHCITYNGENYWLSYNDPQSYENQWGVGTHTVECSIMGFESSFNVEITETPISDIVFEGLSFIERTHGYIASSWDFETNSESGHYYRYNITPEFTAILKDGNELKSEYGCLRYNDQTYYLSYDDPQSYENQWGIGNHTVEYEIMGFNSSFVVTIEETPISEIVFDKASIIENTHGNTTADWDPEIGDHTDEYFRYYNYAPEFTVTLKDGGVLKSENGCIAYNGENYELAYQDNQSYKNRWGVGTRTVECEIMGYKSSFDVTITECPVASIEVEAVTIIEGTNGYMGGGMVRGRPNPQILLL